MATIHISEEEAARDLPGLLKRVRAGEEVVIEKEAAPSVVLRLAEPPRLSITEAVALLPEDSPASIDEDFVRDLDAVVTAHREPLDPPSLAMVRKICFSDIEKLVPEKAAGIYEIHTHSGIPLKVGISGDLRKRLLQHRASRQSGLKLKDGGQRNNPSDVKSKASILAKHLYYDNSLVADCDLKLEAGRRRFLKERCYFTFELTKNTEAARELEKVREGGLRFRYVGDVSER